MATVNGEVGKGYESAKMTDSGFHRLSSTSVKQHQSFLSIGWQNALEAVDYLKPPQAWCASRNTVSTRYRHEDVLVFTSTSMSSTDGRQKLSQQRASWSGRETSSHVARTCKMAAELGI